MLKLCQQKSISLKKCSSNYFPILILQHLFLCKSKRNFNLQLNYPLNEQVLSFRCTNHLKIVNILMVKEEKMKEMGGIKWEKRGCDKKRKKGGRRGE